MDRTNTSKDSSESTLNREESYLGLNLNNGILLSVDGQTSNSDGDSFYDSSESPRTKDAETQTDESFFSDQKRYKYFPDLFEDHTNSTSIISLPSTRINPQNLETEDFDDPSKNQNQNEIKDRGKESKQEKKDEVIEHLPLRERLNLMFNEIVYYIRKPSTAACSSENSNARFYPSDSDSLCNELEISSNVATLKSPMCSDADAMSSIRARKNKDENNFSSSNDSSPLMSTTSPKRLTTILEGTDESVCKQMHDDDSDWSGRCMGRLTNFVDQKHEHRYDLNEKLIRTTSTDTCDDEFSVSCTPSSIEIREQEVFRKGTDLEIEDSLSREHPSIPSGNDVLTSSCRSPISVDMESTKSPTGKKKHATKKRRSLSLPDGCATESESRHDTRDCNNSQTSQSTKSFFVKTNREWKKYSPTSCAQNNAYCIIISPIKPVKYLRDLFTNIQNQNCKGHSLLGHKRIRRDAPFISITPATPN